MRRCVETRDLVASNVPFEVDAALREVNYGSWEGRTLEWLEHNQTELIAKRRRDPVSFRHPGGESFEDVALRLRPLVKRIRNQNSLVIAHRGTLGVLERLLRGLPLRSQIVTPLEPAKFVVIG